MHFKLFLGPPGTAATRPSRAALLSPLAGELEGIIQVGINLTLIVKGIAEGVIGVSADRRACAVNNGFFPVRNDKVLKSQTKKSTIKCTGHL